MTVHCLTPNPALDVTYRTPGFALHCTNRVESVEQRPGGKGVNVARILAARGLQAAVYGPLGGATGDRLMALLKQCGPGIAQRWTPIDGETRRTVAVVDGGDATMLNEPGPRVPGVVWEAAVQTLRARAGTGDVVTVSGSLPTGVTPERVGELVTMLREAASTCVVDTSGPALLAAARAGADVVKPNRDELLEATGQGDVLAGARSLVDLGCGSVVVSLGPEGLLLMAGKVTRRARLARALPGNPTGAGDALVAALAAGLTARSPGEPNSRVLAEALPRAVAWSAAAVLAPVAGEIAAADIDNLIPDVLVEEL